MKTYKAGIFACLYAVFLFALTIMRLKSLALNSQGEMIMSVINYTKKDLTV